MMETQIENILASISESMERISSAVALLEKTVSWIEQREDAFSGEVLKIVATVDQSVDFIQRGRLLEQQLADAREQIAELRTQAGRSQRKTVPANAFQLMAKQGAGAQEVESGALDAALSGLSLEQRIAVKAKLMRGGTLV